MPRGGARPGAGRPKKQTAAPAKPAAKKQALPKLDAEGYKTDPNWPFGKQEPEAPPDLSGLMPLDFLLAALFISLTPLLDLLLFTLVAVPTLPLDLLLVALVISLPPLLNLLLAALFVSLGLAVNDLPLLPVLRGFGAPVPALSVVPLFPR